MTTATFRLADDVPYIRFVKALAEAGIYVRTVNGTGFIVMGPELRAEITQRNETYHGIVLREALRAAGLQPAAIADCAA